MDLEEGCGILTATPSRLKHGCSSVLAELAQVFNPEEADRIFKMGSELQVQSIFGARRWASPGVQPRQP